MTTSKHYDSVDELICARAVSHTDDILLSYQTSDESFTDISGVALERLTSAAAKHYSAALNQDSRKHITKVALIGTSTLDYYLAFLAAQRAGLTTFFISPRLADNGFEHLLNTTNCSAAIVSEGSLHTIHRVCRRLEHQITVVPLVGTESLLKAQSSGGEDIVLPPRPRGYGLQEFIIHSGGTTGLPKPVPLSPASWLAQAGDIAGRMPQVDTLVTLPLFHSFGLATLLRCLVNGKRLSIVSASRPVTATAIASALAKTSSSALVTVPYILKFFADMEDGVDLLAKLKQVIAAGSAIPDALGDLLVTAGVNIFHLYGQTESGALMQPSKDQWNWVTPLPHAEPYLKFELTSDGLYHLIILPGLKAKVYSNRPDGSYATKDLFERHPTDPRKWKFAARKDDIIVLVNGEKADPIPLENCVCQSPYVRAAVAFGAQRDSLGLLVIAAAELPATDILRDIQPYLIEGNARVPAYARVQEDSIIVKAAGTAFPSTDKGTVIRSQFVKQFASDIKQHYARREAGSQAKATLTDSEMHDFVRWVVHQSLRLAETRLLLDTEDFFDLGMDSLQASYVRSFLLRGLDLHGHTPATNVVFEYPTVERLATHLICLRDGLTGSRQAVEIIAHDLVRKYSDFGSPEAGLKVPESRCVIITGATGFIGSHILHDLLLDPSIAEVHCLVRAKPDSLVNARDRIVHALRRLRLLDETELEDNLLKLTTHSCDLSAPDLALTEKTLGLFRAKVTHIIHNAWAVNFNQSLQSFESSCLRPTWTLLRFAASSKLEPKPVFTFISSIAVVLRQPCTESNAVLEELVPFTSVEPMGYAQSKWVGEQIVAAASVSAGLSTQIVRVGQVCGDSVHGVWNPLEAISITIQSALTVKALPAAHEELDWLPVDIVARALVQLTLREKNHGGLSVFHIANKKRIVWDAEFLPYLNKHGLGFEAVEPTEWIRALEGSEQDVEKNPAIKLLDFFRQRYASGKHEQPSFDVSRSERYAAVLRDGVSIDDVLVGKFLKYWLEGPWLQRKEMKR